MGQYFHSATSPKVRVGVFAGPVQAISRERDRRFSPDLSFARSFKSSEDFAPLDLYLDTLEQIESASGTGYLMLRTGVTQNFGDVGVIGKAALHAERLWEALSTIKEGIAYLIDNVEINMRIKFGRCRVEYVQAFTDCAAADLDTQYSIALLANIVQQAVWTPEANMILSYPDARPEHSALFPAAQLVRNSRIGFIEFDDHLLKSPMKHSKASTAAISREMMRLAETTPGGASDMATQIKLLQSASLRMTHSPVSLKDASYFLSIPSRSLQLSLNREKTSFASIRQQARSEVARKTLLEGRPLEEVSQLAGYSHRQTFSKAFTEWEGVSPSEFASRAHAHEN